MSFSRLTKVAAKFDRDITRDEKDRCIKDTLVFVGDNCISNSLEYLIKFKRE